MKILYIIITSVIWIIGMIAVSKAKNKSIELAKEEAEKYKQETINALAKASQLKFDLSASKANESIAKSAIEASRDIHTAVLKKQEEPIKNVIENDRELTEEEKRIAKEISVDPFAD